ncbi:MAG: RDD family protein [Mycobacterium sp.]
MTAVLDATPTTQADDPSAAARPASWLARAGAFALDVLLPTGAVAVLGLLGWISWQYKALLAAGIVLLVLIAVGRWLLPWVTGWSLGRALFGIAVVRRDGAAVGVLRLVGRDLAHLLDTALLFVGWLWPLWDSRRRTFADLLLRTEVRRVQPPERDMRRPTAAVLVAAVLVCAAAVASNYLVVYRHEQAVDAARQQIADQGPRIVEQMLSYGKDTLNDDFARAQSLATDSYRSQLVAQQQAVQKAGATTNEYWAVSSAVLSATPDRASMLLAMQGQRGTDPKDLRFITATVRADFEKSDDGQWRVANLTVLKKPSLKAAPK